MVRRAGSIAGATALLATLLLGGIVQPLNELPGPVAGLASLLPGAALAETLRAALGISQLNGLAPLAVLAAWAVALPLAAARAFRWE